MASVDPCKSIILSTKTAQNDTKQHKTIQKQHKTLQKQHKTIQKHAPSRRDVEEFAVLVLTKFGNRDQVTLRIVMLCQCSNEPPRTM